MARGRSRLGGWPAVLVLVLLGGCARRPVPLPPPAVLPDARELLDLLHFRRSAFASVKALAEVAYTAPDESGKARLVVAAHRPNLIRLEVFSPLGLIFLVTADGKILSAYFPQEAAIYRGKATPGNIARYTRLYMEGEEIIDILMGFPPQRPYGGEGTVIFDEESGQFLLELPVPGGNRQRIWLDRLTFLPQRSEDLAPDGHSFLIVTFADYRQIDGVAIPGRISVEDPRGHNSLRLSYSRVEVNPAISASFFALPHISGAEEIDLDRWGAQG